MVLAFLKAERASPRHFGQYLERVLRDNRLPLSLVDEADVNDARENQIRAAYRGFRRGQLLFAGFPDNVTWRRLALSIPEIGELRYARCSPWGELSKDSLLVRDGAANLDEISTDTSKEILKLAGLIKAGSFPQAEMIIAAESPLSRHVLVEGHTRATAFVLADPPVDEIEVLVGYSPTLTTWRFL